MAITLNQNWIDALTRGGCAPRYLVELHASSTTSYKFLSGKCDQISQPESIASLLPYSRSKDPFKHEVSLDVVNLRLVLTPRIRALVVDNGIRGAKLDVYGGEKSLAESDFVQIGSYQVTDIKQQDGVIELVTKTIEEIVFDGQITGGWLGLHPLQIIYDILTTKLNIPSDRINTSSFAPATWATTSHYVAQMPTGAIMPEFFSQPVKARDVINEMCEMMDGQVVRDNEGKISFVRYDSTASATKDWTEDDFTDFEVSSTYANLKNRISVKSHQGLLENLNAYMSTAMASFVEEESNSQAAFAIVDPGGTDKDYIAEQAIDAKWINGICRPISTIASSVTAGNSFTVVSLGHVCGQRWYPSGLAASQPTDAQLSSSRLLYLLAIAGDGTKELISFDLGTVSASAAMAINYLNENGEVRTSYYFDVMTIRIAERDVLGEGKLDLGAGSYLLDVTVPVNMAANRSTRQAFGGYRVKLKTNLSQMDVEVGDFVTVTTDKFVAYGQDGLDDNVLWEVIGKSVDFSGSPPSISFDLAFAKKTVGAPATSVGASASVGGIQQGSFADLAASSTNAISENFVNSGFTIATSGSSPPEVTISSGEVGSPKGAISYPVTVTLEIPASTTSYLFANALRQSIRISSSSTGLAGEIYLGSVTTNATTVTAIDQDGRTTESVSDAQLQSGAVVDRNLNPELSTSSELLVRNAGLNQYSRG